MYCVSTVVVLLLTLTVFLFDCSNQLLNKDLIEYQLYQSQKQYVALSGFSVKTDFVSHF